MKIKGISVFRQDLADLWKGLLDYLAEHRILKRIVVTLLVIFSLSLGLELLDLAFKPSDDIQRETLKTRFTKTVQSELQRINSTSQFVLDSISSDPQTSFYGQYMSRSASALLLKKYRDLWINYHSHGSSSIRILEQGRLSLAYYDPTNHLQSWHTENFSSPGFDTVYAFGKTLERRNKFTIIDSDEFNLYYISARKIVNKQGAYSGYAVIKYQIALADLTLYHLSRWQWVNADDTTDHGIYIRSTTRSAAKNPRWVFIDSNDRASAFGTLEVDSSYWHTGVGQTTGSNVIALIGAGAELILVLLLITILLQLYTKKVREQGPSRRSLILSIGAVLVCIRIVLFFSVWPVQLLSYFPYLHSVCNPLSIESFFFDPLQQIVSICLSLAFLSFLPLHISFTGKESIKQFQLSYILYSVILILVPGVLLAGYTLYCQLVLEPLMVRLTGITAIIESSLAQSLALSLTAAVILLLIHYSHSIWVRLTQHVIASRSIRGPVLYAFLLVQIAIIYSIAGLDYHETGWKLAITAITILSFFRAVRLSSTQQFSLSKPIGRPGITLLTYLIATGAILYSFQLEQARISVASRQARVKIAKTLYPSESNNETFASTILSKYHRSISDTAIKEKKDFLQRSFGFWRSFVQTHPEYRLSFEIIGAKTGEQLYSIEQTGSNSFIIDSNSSNIHSLHNVTVLDTTTGSSYWGMPIVLRLRLFYQEQHRLLPSDRLSDILWSSVYGAGDNSNSGFALVDPSAERILQGRFPDGYFDFSQLRNSYSGEGIYTTPSHEYIYASSERLTPERSRAIAFIPFASFKDFLHISAEIIDVTLVLSLCCCICLLLWRVVEQQKRIVMLSLQERSLLIVLAAIIISFFVISRVVESSLKTAIMAASEESFHSKTIGIKNQLFPMLFRDSNHIQQQLNHEAEARNCDLVLYNDQNVAVRSTAPDCFEHSLLPVTLPTTFDWRLGERANSEATGSSAVLGIPLNVWVASIAPFPGDTTSRQYKAMVIQREESYTVLQHHVNAYIFDGMTVMALLILGFASYLAARSVRPLRQIKEAVETIASGSLAVTLPTKRSDEIGEVIEAFNTMTKELATSRERVAQTEREGAWREMARQVAHEIKNPLTPMKLSIQHVQHAFEHQDTNFQNIFRRVLRTLNEQIDVMTRIATEFARFGEMPRRRYGFISLAKVVDSAVALFDAERSRIRFAVDIAPNIGRIYGDEEEFRRTLVNLIKNALQAIDKWGIILITAQERSGLIYLKISDSGGGMNEETLRKAFDPNFSTKTSGMGLGLAIVKKTITDMSGTIRVESELGKGTTFYIELPSREGLPTA